MRMSWYICFANAMSSRLFFFFKQKTAYEMRISDWSSDVCSSDLRYDDGIGDGRVEDPDPRVVDRAECRNRQHGLKLRRLREVGLALEHGEAVAETFALVDEVGRDGEVAALVRRA